jgi:hypothetical protein
MWLSFCPSVPQRDGLARSFEAPVQRQILSFSRPRPLRQAPSFCWRFGLGSTTLTLPDTSQTTVLTAVVNEQARVTFCPG